MATLRLFFASAKNANKAAKRNGDGGDGRYGAGDAGDALDDAGEHGDPLNDGDATDYASSEDSQS